MMAENTKQKVKGRFAPTPSGRMHLGNLMCALLAWLSAKSQGGTMVLRIEDLDRERSLEKYRTLLIEDLDWLGLSFEEGPGENGPCAPYDQSRRYPIYEQDYRRLLPRIYPCFCSRAALHAASAPHLSDGRVLYSGVCRTLTEQQRKERMRLRAPACRIAVEDTVIGFTDGVQGWYQASLAQECGDFIVRRADGVLAYQLAVVLDDARMGITQVVRGRDLLSSTPQQIWLYQLLGFSVPEFYHIPLLTDPEGKRLSKRDLDLDLGILRQTYRSQQLTGMLGYLCGQLPMPQPITPAELAQRFDWAKVPRQDIALPRSLLSDLSKL